ncbi:MAG: type II secretion system protein GspD [Armatimonadota bacterium]
MHRVLRRLARARSVPVLLVLVMVLISAAASFAQSSDSARISLNVWDKELSKIVQLLMSQSKQSIVIRDQDELGGRKVSVSLTDMPFETVLRYVVAAADGELERDAQGVYVIGKKRAVAPLAQAVASPGDGGYASYGRTEPVRRETSVETIKLYNTSAVDMMWLLGLYNPVDAPKIENSSFKPGVYLQDVKNGGYSPMATPGQQTPPLQDSMTRNMSEANRMPSASFEMAQLPGAPGNFGGPSRANNPSPNPAGVPGTGTGTTGTGALLPDDVDVVVPYPTDNSLIVRGSEEGIAELKELISKLDVPPKQIMIKAEFVEISTTDASTLGVDWSFERGNTTFQTNFNPAGNVIIGYASGNVMASLAAQVSNNKAKLVNAPMISTMNNVPGVIRIGKIVPYWTSNVVVTNNNPVVTYVPLFLPIQSELVVLPRVNPADNTITVMVQPTVNDAGDPVTGPDGTEIPVQNQQQLQAICRVRDGETIVLGGIIRKSDSASVTGIPLLKDLPIIGPLFRSTTKRSQDTELLIFLTPTIRPDAPTDRNSYSGIGVGVTP